MLRKVISIIVAIVALILLFLLVRAAINAFTGDPEPDAPVQTEATVTDPAENEASENPRDNAATNEETAPDADANANASGTASTTRGNGAAAGSSDELANAGPAETAMVTIAVTSALGTMLYVRRRQLANL